MLFEHALNMIFVKCTTQWRKRFVGNMGLNNEVIAWDAGYNVYVHICRKQ